MGYDFHTVTHDETEYVVVHLVAYADDADLDVQYDGETPVVANHDELEKYDEVRLLTRDAVMEHGLEREALSPESSLWREEFDDLEPGDAVRLGEGGDD